MAVINFQPRLKELVPGNTQFTWKDTLYSNTAAAANILNAPEPMNPPDGTTYQYQIDDTIAENIKVLVAKIMVPIHSAVPYTITSVYRSFKTNLLVGSKTGKGGQHSKGQAIDMVAKGGKSNRDLFNYVKDNLDFDQMIWEKGTPPPDGNPDWVHVSYDPNKPKQRKEMLVFDGSTYKKYNPASTSPPTEKANTADEETKSDVAPAEDPQSDASKKNLQALFDEINTNQNNIELSDTDATWGKRSASSETSDWISLKQYLLYLCTKYVPQTVLPFVELIPVVMVDGALPAGKAQEYLSQLGHNDGKTPEELKKNYEKQPPKGKKLIDRLLKQIGEPLPPGYNKERFNLSAKTTNQQSGKTDLFNMDPFREGYKNLTDFSDSGQIAFAQRAVGLRIYSQLVLTPSPIAGVPSKPGGIGFKKVEIKAGSQSDNGLAMITMELLDIQGNKFTDINSPWSFIFDTRPGSQGGDFYFRYGWELRLPKPGDKTDLSSNLFWNHPGWGLFEKQKLELQSQLQGPDYKIYLTQAIGESEVINQGQFYNSATEFNEETGEISVRQKLLEDPLSPFVRLSILNPELSVDSTTGAITATLTFMTTGAVVSMVPVIAAANTKKLAATGKIMTLAQLLVAFDADCNQFGVLSVSNPEKREFLEKVAKRKGGNLKRLLAGESLKSIAIVLGADANTGLGAGNAEIDPNQVIIKLSKGLNNDLNEVNADQTKTLIRWFRQVLEDNDCVLLSTATGSGAGINSRYVITTTQNIEENEAKFGVKKSKAFDVNNVEGTSLQDLLANEKPVFSFRFQGTLVETLEVAKTDTTNSAAIAANFSLNDLATDEANPADNDTKGAIGPVATTAADRQRNLLAIYAQLQNVNIGCMAHPWLGPGDYLFVKGMGFFDGRYQLLTVTHLLEGHKFTSQLEAARLLPAAAQQDQQGSKENAQSNGRNNFAEPVTKQQASNGTKNKAIEKLQSFKSSK